MKVNPDNLIMLDYDFDELFIGNHQKNGIVCFVDMSEMANELEHSIIQIRRKQKQTACFDFKHDPSSGCYHLGWWTDAEVIYDSRKENNDE